ncbi:hypothetical protein P3X46_013357 [Hevea brasiliensis]|uniref:Protein kinase domain-containing protein n=1 Tax=Hevea brasiliensis TaxID=3981 RepID=A0ABQ9M380_HEVBR|nr:hypothetical protein P3X46_013357 [Hevea brasiliensis]
MGLSYRSLSFCLFSIIHFFFLNLPAFAILRNNETDRIALLEFKAKITRDPLGIMRSWNDTLHFCQWYGVTCGRRHQRVTVLDLPSLQLSGSISPHVGNLSFLRKLYLPNNSFSHEIPSQIGNLRRLQRLVIHNNSLSGQIPANLSGCSNLILIFLDDNELVGTIPAGISSLPKLYFLSIAINNLTGTIPPSFGNLSSLERLYAYRNNFHGLVPRTLGQLMNLRFLSLSDNQLSGTFPPSIFNLSLLDNIDLGFNHLQGNLPLDLGISHPNLNFFSISYNQFNGTIPTSICNATILRVLQLASNNLIGRVPSLEKLHRLWRLNIADNHFGSGKVGDLNFLSGLTNATTLIYLNIANNSFEGKLPEYIGNFSKKLERIDINNNQFFGNIPIGIEFLVGLKGLYAEDNRLSGTIPSSIGKLENLVELFLGNNNFLGSIPSSLGNLTNLLSIDLAVNNLQGLIPSSLGNCKNLLTLDLSVNNLTGPIPPEITQLSSLSTFLNLSRNHLSGSLPMEVGNLKNLGILALDENKLSGNIPSSLGSCTRLEFLYMGGNYFQGTIPSSLSALRGIRELNLSRNNFSGKIPEFLKEFNSLEYLDLSYNDFEGMVPIEGIFKDGNATSVAGNKNLCGGIPDFGLPACKIEQQKGRLTVRLKKIISVVSVLVGAILALICLFLYLSRRRKGESTSITFGNALLKLSYRKLLKATNGFSSDNLIGIGNFGSVFKGTLEQEGMVIAVKVLNLMHRGALKSFMAECEALRNIRHRNLVKILTACSGVNYQGDDFKALVYEFMINGSLDGWLHPTLGSNEVSRTLNILQRLNIAIDVACALEYLQLHCETPIVHCDLKPSNVLLDEEMTGHISDFGLVKFLFNELLGNSTNQSSSIGLRGTIGYCPPEYGVGSEISTSGDIFSFGILLLEMFTGKRPTNNMFKENLSLHNFVKKALPAQVIEIIDPNLFQAQLDANHNHNFRNRRNDLLIECSISIFEIGISCSAESPQERMNIGDIVAQLSHVKNTLLGAELPREREAASAFLLTGKQNQLTSLYQLNFYWQAMIIQKSDYCLPQVHKVDDLDAIAKCLLIYKA